MVLTEVKGTIVGLEHNDKEDIVMITIMIEVRQIHADVANLVSRASFRS